MTDMKWLREFNSTIGSKPSNEITIGIKAKLTVDEQTFYTCLRLIATHAKDKGLEGMVLRFHDRGEPYSIMPLTTKEDVERAMYGKLEESED